MEITKNLIEKFKNKILIYRKNPLLFCKEILNKNFYWSKQIEIIEKIKSYNRVTVPSGHDVGKTFVSADIVLWFLYTHYPSIVITTAPTWRQVEKVLWGEIRKHHAEAKILLSQPPLETEIKLGPKWYAMGFSSDKPSNFQGYHEEHILVVVDEPSGIEDEIFEAIESILANEDAKLLLIGNPIKDIGYFARSLSDPRFQVVHIDCLESPNVKADKIIYKSLVTKKWCDEKREEWGEDSPMFLARVRGLLPKESIDTLIPLSWVEKAVLRYEEFKDQKSNFPIQIGLDVARFGSNQTVFIVRQGRKILEIDSYAGNDIVKTAQIAEDKIFKFNPENVIVDDNGVGGGVTDILNSKNYKNIVPVNAGEKADEEEKYLNKRAELAWRVREAFRKQELDIPRHDKLMFECSNQYYDIDNRQKVRVMSKSMLRKKGLESPDFFDALTLTYAREIPESYAIKNATHKIEFAQNIHVLNLKNIFKDQIGITHYMVLIPELNDSSFALWACADKEKFIYVYDEAQIYRTTSSLVYELLKQKEFYKVWDRFMPKVYNVAEAHDVGFSFKDQLAEHQLYFNEIDYDETLANVTIREGLRFNSELPFSKFNHPYIFFHPSCIKMIQAIKYYLNGQVDIDGKGFLKALGILVMAEPLWIPKKQMEESLVG